MGTRPNKDYEDMLEESFTKQRNEKFKQLSADRNEVYKRYRDASYKTDVLEENASRAITRLVDNRIEVYRLGEQVGVLNKEIIEFENSELAVIDE